ncbi:DNA-directed RNA polymerase [Orbilia brochopaga]|uniref:DNA-directed RNA polymerase n=1 Tax=Orbilia brochopaga TaxID=3140254 RepID=A0AAV9V2T7_9PEZI
MLVRRCGRRQFPLRSTIQHCSAATYRPPRCQIPAYGTTSLLLRRFSATPHANSVSSSSNSTGATSTSSSSSPKKIDRTSVQSERNYSTATDVGQTEYPPAGGFPFYSKPEPQQPAKESSESSAASTSNESPPDFSWLRLHDPASFLMLNTPELPMHARPFELSRQAVDPFKIGTGSHREDVISAFLACVKMRKLDRAEIMLDRLHHDFIACTSIEQDQKSQDQEMVKNHNYFLRGYLGQAKEAAEIKEEYEKKKEVLSAASKEPPINIEADATSAGAEKEPTPTESKSEIRARIKEAEAALEYNVSKIEGWFRQNMTETYKLKGNDDTYAILMEAAILSSRQARAKKQEVAKIIFEWQQRKAGILGDVLRHLPASSIEFVKAAHKITKRDLHLEQEYILHDYKKPEIDEVMATDIKGSSLAAVKQSLQSFADHSVEKYMPIFKTQEERDQYAIDRQKVLEQDAYEAAISRWRADAEDPSGGLSRSHNPALNPLLHQWLVNMIPLIKQELKNVEEAEANPQETSNFERCQYGPYLRLLSPEKLAGITITNILRLATGWHDSTAMKASAAVISVGRAVEQEYISEQLKKQLETKQGDAKFFEKKSLQKQLAEARNERDVSLLVYRQNRRAEMEQDGSALILEQRWSQPIKAKVGSILVSLLFQCAKINAKPTNPKVLNTVPEDLTLEQPALYHGYQFVGGKKIGVIKLHDEFSSKLMSEPLKGTTLTKLLPMVARPRPWCAWNDGAYYFTPCRMVRIKDCLEQTLYIKEASKQGNLDRIFAGLDVLGSTAWKINQKVFDVILKVWNTGEAFAAIPPSSSKDMPFPEEPPADADVATKAAFKVAHQELALLRKNHHSQRCDVNFKMEIARAFYNEEFYFPHNVDFRGRAYAMPPHLNHIGNDLCRGLLKFSEKKPLGESGLRWLKIHLANLCGFDKASLKAREEWTEANLEKVFDSARKPLEGTRWWLESEDPWQTLATCFELEEALTSPDPLAFESNMPVHQDGTCNGLQHYAALGGDIAGARQVNLEPAEKPQDVYTGVAELVNDAVIEDAKNGHPEAKELLGHINRKVVKQTVMTNVYGVTFIGAKAQVKNRLVEKGVFAKDRTDKLALYLTRKIFNSLQTMFTGAHLIQKWFGECAKRISRSVSPQQYQSLTQHLDGSIPLEGRQPHTKERGKVEFMTSVVWTTPLGLPVVQPYRHEATVAVKTNLQQITIVDTSIINQVNSRRQMAAFPPNFVHSLDATHMLLSALASKQAGLTFAAVHDSFWTHACHVDTMSRVLRDAFVNLHSEDIVQKLRDEFVVRYKGYKTLVVVPESHPAGRAIMQHRKEISPIIEARKAEAEAARIAKEAQEQAEAIEAGLIEKPRKKNGPKLKPSKSKKISMTVVDDLMLELDRDRLLASKDPEERMKGEKMVTAASIYQSFGLTPDSDFDKVESAGFGEEMSSGGGDIDLLALQLQDTEGKKASTKASKAKAGAEEKEAKDGEEAKKKKPSPKGIWQRVYVWVDMEFPEVPQKGGFDVSRLKDSKYFFS